MNVLLDYDATTADSFAAQVRRVNEEFGTDYTLSMFTSWRSEDLLTEEEADFMWGHRCFLNEDFQAALPPVDGAIETIRNLLDEGFEFIIASDRPDSLYNVTRSWLNEHGLQDIHLIFTHHKQSLNTPVRKKPSLTKLEVIEQYGCTMAIDDAPHHATAFANLDIMQEIFLLDMPYNQQVPHHKKIFRCLDWQKVYDWVHMLHPERYMDVADNGLHVRVPDNTIRIPSNNTIKISGRVDLIPTKGGIR